VLPRFAADLDWLRSQGISVERFNLAQEPDAFIRNATVHQLLTAKGVDCLPLIFVDETLVDQTRYPTREMLIGWTGLVPKFPSLSIVFGQPCLQ
jgi:arsenite methyltransferase